MYVKCKTIDPDDKPKKCKNCGERFPEDSS